MLTRWKKPHGSLICCLKDSCLFCALSSLSYLWLNLLSKSFLYRLEILQRGLKWTLLTFCFIEFSTKTFLDGDCEENIFETTGYNPNMSCLHPLNSFLTVSRMCRDSFKLVKICAEVIAVCVGVWVCVPACLRSCMWVEGGTQKDQFQTSLPIFNVQIWHNLPQAC